MHPARSVPLSASVDTESASALPPRTRLAVSRLQFPITYHPSTLLPQCTILRAFWRVQSNPFTSSSTYSFSPSNDPTTCMTVWSTVSSETPPPNLDRFPASVHAVGLAPCSPRPPSSQASTTVLIISTNPSLAPLSTPSIAFLALYTILGTLAKQGASWLIDSRSTSRILDPAMISRSRTISVQLVIPFNTYLNRGH